MSHGEEEEFPRGDSAPGDPIDLPVTAESTPQVPDFFADSFPGKPANFFSDSGGGDNVEESGVTVADLSVDSNRDENGGGEEEASGGLRGEDGETTTAPPKVIAATDHFDTNESEITESTMAETLINGLHQMDHGAEIVLPTAEERDHQRSVVDNSDQQSFAAASEQPSDERAEAVGSPRKRIDNGSGEGHGAGRPAMEHHRRPPISGSHGGGPLGGKSLDSSSASSADVSTPRPASGPGIVGDVLHSIASEEEEGRSRQRILAFAAKRYSTAVERNPEDHDALYNWALVLQESADNTPLEGGNLAKDALLEEACRKYEAATELCPTLHEAFYNWAIAISDRAKIRGRTKEAEELWKQACERYDKSVQLNWNSPQALNNWGLALQELGAIVPLKEKRAIVKKAIRKFRAAIRLRFDFHRAVYNLGTVLYGLAEDTLRGGRKVAGRESTQAEFYSQSAIYIAAAHALKPDYPVYRSALRLVRSMLPLPYMKAGYLIMPPVHDSLAPHSDWQRLWFVLDHEALYEMEKLERKTLTGSASRRSSGIGESSNSIPPTRAPLLRIEMEHIVRMVPCADLSLPPGGGFRIDTLNGPQFLIADTWESMDGWVDAVRLVYTIFARGKRDTLAGLLAG